MRNRKIEGKDGVSKEVVEGLALVGGYAQEKEGERRIRLEGKVSQGGDDACGERGKAQRSSCVEWSP